LITSMGEHMNTAAVLDIIEDLHRRAAHPDIASIDRYDGALAGVELRYQSTSKVYLAVVDPGKAKVTPHPLPEGVLPIKQRAPRALKLLHDLLETARPAQFTSWQPVAVEDIGLQPCGLGIVCADGSRVLVRVTAGGATQGFEPETDPYPDYVIPAGAFA
jgi:hypothetical protein